MGSLFLCTLVCMNTELLDYIKLLSKRDKKPLAEKALKVAEEQGELAKAILPYVSSYATQHRFVDKYKILEEVADTMLAAISIAYDLDFTHEEIEEVLDRKSQYWQSLQDKEDETPGPWPYEIHLTVETQLFSDAFISRFKSNCIEIGVKPIVLDLENNGGVVLTDVMTSSKHKGDNTSVYTESQRIKKELLNRGYKILREKIETVPWHPGSPRKKTDTMPKGCYFESHVAVEVDDSDERKEILQELAKKFDGHLSRNVFKKISEGKFIQMVTFRKYDTYKDWFLDHVHMVVYNIKRAGFDVPKTEIEFCLYDTKNTHDYLWLKKNEQTLENR